jgi:integrase
MPTKTTDTTRMKGGVRRRSGGGNWSYTLELGTQDAQRCRSCRRRYWLERRRLDACPKCGGQMVDTHEQRQQVTGGFKTEAEAKAARIEVLHNIKTGSYVPRDSVTLGAYLRDEWLPSLTSAKIRKTTAASYESHVVNHLYPALGSVPLQKLTRERIAKAYGTMLAEGRIIRPTKVKRKTEPEHKPLSPSTVRRVHATLHRALRDAVRSHRIPRNPADDVELPDVDNEDGTERALPAWDSAQLRQFLQSVREDRLRALWLLYSTTGCRRGELLGLRWKDVSMDRATMTIRQTRVPMGRQVITGSPKTKAGRRTLSVDPATVAVLRQHSAEQKRERMAAGPKWQVSDYVFTTDTGEPLSPTRVSRMFIAASAKAALPRIPLHGLRHTYATIALVEQRLPVSMVSRRLGHAKVSITLDIYSHAMDRHDEEAALSVASLVVPEGF